MVFFLGEKGLRGKRFFFNIYNLGVYRNFVVILLGSIFLDGERMFVFMFRVF